MLETAAVEEAEACLSTAAAAAGFYPVPVQGCDCDGAMLH